MATTTRGAAAATVSQVLCSEGSPAKPSTSMPPAMSTSCGVQWPATKTGSNHSIAATGTRSALRTATRTASIRARWRAMRSSAALRERVSWAMVRTSPKDSPSVCGSRATTRGRLGIVLGHRAHVVDADGAHRAQRLGDDQVGLELAQALGVELVDRLAALGALAHGGVDLGRAQSAGQAVARDAAVARVAASG